MNITRRGLWKLLGGTALAGAAAQFLPPKEIPVLITGGGGQGATAISTVYLGRVESVIVLSAGSGYTTMPTITLTS